MNDYNDIRFAVLANISQLANKAQNVMNLGMQDISSKQWLPLILIEQFEHEPTLNEVAAKCGITHQSAKQLIDKLIEKDYVILRKDDVDKRYVRLSLTEKGKQWGLSNYRRNQEFTFGLFDEIADEDVKTFYRVQQKLMSKLDEIKKTVKSKDK